MDIWKEKSTRGIQGTASNVFAAKVLGRSMGTEDAEVGGGQIQEGKKGLVHGLEFVNRPWGPGLLSWERRDAFLPQTYSVDCPSLQRRPALPQANSASPPGAQA